ncbi:MAG: hypothetical protein AAGC81_10020 [Pseudomonadota bacterium]
MMVRSAGFKARTKLACEIANLDPQQLNEVISFKHFNCAPKTKAGSARVFQRDDIVVLIVLSLLLKAPLKQSQAGFIACEIKDVLKSDHGSKLEWITFFQDMAGFSVCLAGQMNPDEKPAAFGPIFFELSFPVGAFRRDVEEKLAEHATILGSE